MVNFKIIGYYHRKYLNSFKTLNLKTEKETPPVGVKPNASHLLDECPRLLGHIKCQFLENINTQIQLKY